MFKKNIYKIQFAYQSNIIYTLIAARNPAHALRKFNRQYACVIPISISLYMVKENNDVFQKEK